MTSALLSSSAPCCSSQRRAGTLLSSSSPAYQRYHLSASAPRLSALSFSPWVGLKHFAISFPRNYTHSERKSKSCRMAVYASLFGVGAPEALVIGVVALLVFGPKGLAEVARNLGKTLRSFQPTIRELQEVSREFKSTFEREIGLDEVTSTAKNSYRSNSIVNENQQTTSDPNGRPTAELSKETMKITEEQVDATTKSQAELPKEQLQDAPTSEPAASIPAPSGETASAVLEASVQIPSPERTENEGSK